MFGNSAASVGGTTVINRDGTYVIVTRRPAGPEIRES